MPTRCVAVGCSNTYATPGISLHTFPRSQEVRKLWVLAVRRENWQPTESSRLCSAHFKNDDFVYDPSMAAGVPCKMRRALKPDSVPSAFSYNDYNRSSEQCSPEAAKRRRAEIVDSALAAGAPSAALTDTALDCEQDEDIGEEASSCDAETDIAVSVNEDDTGDSACCPTCGHKKPKTSSKYVQVVLAKACAQKATMTTVVHKSSGAQTNESSFQLGLVRSSTPIMDWAPHCDLASPCSEHEDTNDSDDENFDVGKIDMEDESFALSEASIHQVPASDDTISEMKYIVFESCLTHLFERCRTCQATCRVQKTTDGSLLRLTATCPLQHVWSWESQPSLNRKAIGNILLAGAILFTGSNPKKALRLLSSIGVAVPKLRLYFVIQAALLFPSVHKLWTEEQRCLISEASGQPLNLAGDGRCDSPGFSAKYLTYTLADTNRDIILHTELVQVNEVGNSVRMEHEGLKRGLEFLLQMNCCISNIVTDRHSSIRAFLKNCYPDIVHLFDCWHVAKGIKKKMLAASKCRGLEILAKWSQATVNHLYWCAASSNGHPEQILPKWTSLTSHVVNIHEHDFTAFPRCAHGDLSGDERLWLDEGSDAHRKLREIVHAPTLLKDVGQLSTTNQTYSCEAFNSLINQFAPKTYHYSHGGMKARVAIAAMHYNENRGRKQALTSSGEKRWAVRFRKGRRGEATLSAVMDEPSYGYVRSLLEETLRWCSEYHTYKEALEATRGAVSAPPSVASEYCRPAKEGLIALHRSRFNK